MSSHIHAVPASAAPGDATLCTRCGAALIADGIELDWNRREIRQVREGRDDAVASFGPVQIDILAVLFREQPKWCHVERIVARVYGHGHAAENPAGTVRTLVYDIRLKLRAAGIALAIEGSGTGRDSRGYRLASPIQTHKAAA